MIRLTNEQMVRCMKKKTDKGSNEQIEMETNEQMFRWEMNKWSENRGRKRQMKMIRWKMNEWSDEQRIKLTENEITKWTNN